MATNTTDFYLGQELDYFPESKMGKYQGEYYLRDESGNLIHNGTNHEEWYEVKEEWKNARQSNSSNSDSNSRDDFEVETQINTKSNVDSNVDRQILELVNNEREEAGLDPVSLNNELNKAADLHTEKMVEADKMSHSLPGEAGLGDRVNDSGYDWNSVAENIAAGSTTPEEVMYHEDWGWMNSPGHKENILNPEFTQLGVGYENAPDSNDSNNDQDTYWTQVFANGDSNSSQENNNNDDEVKVESMENESSEGNDDNEVKDESTVDESFEDNNDDEAKVESMENESSEGNDDNEVKDESTVDESFEEMEQNFEDTNIQSPSNAGTPIENPNLPADVDDGNDIDKLDFDSKYANPNGGGGNDQYFGTAGVNNYVFNPLLNAKPEIYEKHTNDNGKINWQGVAGENDNYHDHWVDSIGKDTIMNFSGKGGDGDKITIKGHTVAATVLEESDSQVKLGIYSDQGADGSRGNGAHDFDVLGTITVNHDGNFDYSNVDVVTNNVFDGAFEYA